MAEQHSQQQILVGFPSAGKSTFLAALWQVITTGEVASSLSLINLDSDSVHIDMIHKEWLAGNPLKRTGVVEVDQISPVIMGLGRNGVEEVKLVIPDVGGEYFELQWTERRWPKDYDDLLKSANSFLLFVNPDRLTLGSMLTPEVGQLVSLLQTDEDAANDQPPAKEFDPKKSPTQVKFVELLQYFASRDYLLHLRKCVIIISAWDLLEKHFQSPDAWFEKQMPFLWQYLQTNDERFEYRIYGISAQGGELEDGEKRPTEKKKELLQLMRPSERIKVKYGENPTHHDITEPIKWLVGLSDHDG